MGGESEVRAAVARLRPEADADEAVASLVALADRYLSGWRPSRFEEADPQG